jgi:hypothetical protein
MTRVTESQLDAVVRVVLRELTHTIKDFGVIPRDDIFGSFVDELVLRYGNVDAEELQYGSLFSRFHESLKRVHDVEDDDAACVELPAVSIRFSPLRAEKELRKRAWYDRFYTGPVQSDGWGSVCAWGVGGSAGGNLRIGLALGLLQHLASVVPGCHKDSRRVGFGFAKDGAMMAGDGTGLDGGAFMSCLISESENESESPRHIGLDRNVIDMPFAALGLVPAPHQVISAGLP